MPREGLLIPVFCACLVFALLPTVIWDSSIVYQELASSPCIFNAWLNCLTCRHFWMQAGGQTWRKLYTWMCWGLMAGLSLGSHLPLNLSHTWQRKEYRSYSEYPLKKTNNLIPTPCDITAKTKTTNEKKKNSLCTLTLISLDFPWSVSKSWLINCGKFN